MASTTSSTAILLLASTLFLSAYPALATFGWPVLSSGGSSACPTTNPGWYQTGCNGGIVDPDNDLLGTNGTPYLLYQFYPLGAGGVTSAAKCKSLCESWPVFNLKTLLPLNGKSDKCAYWSWNGLNDCYLYSCGVCKSAVSFSTTAKCGSNDYVSGALSIAATCGTGGVKGDPHFTGADNSHFDFTGVPGKTYCLVSDSHLHVNAYYGGRYAAWGNESSKPLTWIRQVGILWGHHSIRLAAREGGRWQYDEGYMARAEVDGEEAELAQVGASARSADGKIELSWISARESSGDDEIDVYQVEILGVLTLRLTLRPEVAHLRTPEDGVVHFNLDFDAVDVSDNAHGVLGQTYRADHKARLSESKLVYSDLLGVDMVEGTNAEGFLDGTPDDYSASGIMASDCKMSRFARLSVLDGETSRAMELSKGAAISTQSFPRKALGSYKVDTM